MNKVKELISIIIPAYNTEKYIRSTLQSVIQQSYVFFECIVIDDGSVDATADVVNSFSDKRIRLFRQKNAGVSAARNWGLRLSRGELIVFLDSDDLLHPDALKILHSAMVEHANISLAWARSTRFDDETKKILEQPAWNVQQTKNIWYNLLIDNFMPFGSFVVRSSNINEIFFDTSLKIGEDRDWLLRVLHYVDAIFVDTNIHYYRQRKNSAIRNYKKFIDDESRFMRRYLDAAEVPTYIRKRAYSALAFHAFVLLSKMPGHRFEAILKYIEAIYMDPLYLENYIRPIRKLFFTIFPAKKIDIVEIINNK